MAEVLVTLKVMPADAEADPEAIVGEIKKLRSARLNKVEMVPIAFGLVSLHASFVVEDAEGGATAIEEEVRSIPGVGSVEVVEVTRLL
jgi:translation elongation factor aEF-1 beta